MRVESIYMIESSIHKVPHFFIAYWLQHWYVHVK